MTALPGHAVLSVAIKNPAGPGVTGRIDCTTKLDNRQWVVDIAADSENRLHAHGAIGVHDDALSGTFSLNIGNGATISRLFLANPVTGFLSGAGDLGGNVKQPAVRFNLRVHDLAWRGASIDRLSVAAFYANKQLYINRASLRSNGELAAIFPLFGIHNAEGRFHVAAEGYGPIGNPSVSAEIGMTDLHSDNFTAASFIASLAYRNDTLRWDNVRLGKNAAWIKSSGLAFLHGKRRFARVSIMAERQGYKSASCTASGVFAGDSIDASVNVGGMDPGLLSPWIKEKVPLHGMLALRAEVHGTTRNPIARAHIDFDQTLGRASTIRYRAEAVLQNAELNASVRAYPFGRPESLLVSLSAPLALSPPWTAAHLIRDGARVSIEGADFPLGEFAEQFMPEVKAGEAFRCMPQLSKTRGHGRCGEASPEGSRRQSTRQRRSSSTVYQPKWESAATPFTRRLRCR